MKRETTLKNVKGSYDYSHEEQTLRNYIQDTLRDVFEKYGYRPLETPILCYYDMLAGKYDESNDLLKEIYKLSDQGDRELGLRYDLTVPFAKYIALTKDLRLPYKRYEMGKVFRDGPVKIGRDREFMQCDVDVVGIDGNLIEAELISLWLAGYKKLDIDVYIKYNSRNLMRGLIKEVVDLDEEGITKVVTIIDKMDKISKKDLLKELLSAGLDNDKANIMLEYYQKSLDELAEIFESTSNETLAQGIKELVSLRDMLDGIGCGEDAIFTPSLARGQDYYTGNVFEVYAKNGELSCSLGGGGRYDKMITDFIDDGNTYPAVGVSFGLSTIYEILKNRDGRTKNHSYIYIVPMNTEAESLKLANTLRDMGYDVELEMTGRKIKKCFEYANKEKIPYVIVLGEDEVTKNKFKIKKMETGEEFEFPFDDLQDVYEVLYHPYEKH